MAQVPRFCGHRRHPCDEAADPCGARPSATSRSPGHNIKLGRGGIREIEFFVQTQQLIAGGRQVDLRVADTLTALERLEARGWIKPGVKDGLSGSYCFLRRIEHRLQMIADEQTQTLPDDPDELERLARFSGFPTFAAFSEALVSHLQRVQSHYAVLFEASPVLTTAGANMVFAGEADDPATVAALAAMGYERPSDAIAAVRGWHHGRYQAVRTPRARELLTEVQPLLIEALAKTSDPDLALSQLRPLSRRSAVGRAALLAAEGNNPSLLRLVADIMGSAPRLARILARRRRVLDAVLDPGFFGKVPDRQALGRLVADEILAAGDYQDALDRARVIGNEQAFLIGVRVLSGTIEAAQAGGAYADLAEHLIRALQMCVEADMARAHGRVAGGGAVVVAMGKLGGREMTAASDLDLIVIYDFDPNCSQSDGARPLAVSQYFARFTQRLVSALSAPTAEGALYEVDMRLRPSGQKGPVAVQLSSFVALPGERRLDVGAHGSDPRPGHFRARRPHGQGRGGDRGDARPRATGDEKIAADVREMRALIEKEKGTTDIWDLKQVRGGLVDLEFIAQYLQLVTAHRSPGVLSRTRSRRSRRWRRMSVLGQEDAEIADGDRPSGERPDAGAAALSRRWLRSGQGTGRPEGPAGPGRRGADVRSPRGKAARHAGGGGKGLRPAGPVTATERGGMDRSFA